jgi:hypothetical protein
MGPFGDEDDAELVGDVVDGQVIGSTTAQAPPPPPPSQEPVVQAFTPEMAAQARGVVVLKLDPSNYTGTAPVDITDEFLALAMNRRSRAYALFLEVPFFAFVALSPKLPGLVRVGAAVLGVMRALEVTERQAEFEQYLTEF